MKGGDYLQQLKCDRDNLVEQAANLRRRIEVLNLEVGEMLAMLPSGEELKFLNADPKIRPNFRIQISFRYEVKSLKSVLP